jgi:hypothetical protein
MATLYATENTGAIYTATLEDSSGTAIPLANLTTITLTLYDVASGDIINSRNDQNVLNQNNITIHATSGLLTWTMQAADNAILDDDLDWEHHRALFEFVFSGTGSPGKHEGNFMIRNLSKVP